MDSLQPPRRGKLTRRLVPAAILAVAAFVHLDSAAAGEKVRLAQNQSPISAISIIADREGFFTKNGLDVEVINFTTGKQCLDTVMGGAADIATTAEAPTTAAAMAGEDRVPRAHRILLHQGPDGRFRGHRQAC